MEKIVIIDGSSYFFRAFYAIQRLRTSKGFPTNAIFGFINMLIRVLEVEKPKYLCIAFDTPKPSFRKKIYPEYKANRSAPPEELVVQIPMILRAVDAFKVHRIEMEGFEADDIIGTLSREAAKHGFNVDIISGDKDLMQLVDSKVTLYDSMKDKRYDAVQVKKKFNVAPDQIIDFLALMGDSSDNIPGVTGIGEKTAAELIQTYDSLENLYKKIDTIKSEKRRETLMKEREIAFLSRELATIKCDIPIPFNPKDLTYTGPNLDALKTLFIEFEFQNLLKRFSIKTDEQTFSQGTYEAIQTKENLLKLVTELKQAKTLSVDTETTSLSVHSAKCVGISLSSKLGKAYYVPILHDQGVQLSENILREYLKPVLEDPNILKVGQNLKFDFQILKKWGVNVEGPISDTLVASYLLDPEARHNLDALAFKFLGHQNITYGEVTDNGRLNFREVSIEKATAYSGEDSDVALRLHEKLIPNLKSQNLIHLYEEVELPLVRVLSEMEYVGVKVDKDRLEKMSAELEHEMANVQTKIHSLAGESFNINSPKQLGLILFEKLNLPKQRKTKTGFSTDEGVLKQLSENHEIAQWIVRFRELGKLKSTFVDGLLSQIHPETKRIHTHYNQTITATGRLSSSDPNLQNIPTTREPKYDIRSVFIPEKGHVLISADYSQIELRLLAHFSKDEELTRAFHHDEDIHSRTAELLFGSRAPEHRKIAKTINFGIIYGQTPYGLSQQLQISPKEAKQFIDNYFKQYNRVQTYFESVIEEAKKLGYVATFLGRKRNISEINSENKMRREMAERIAINTPLQGSAADLIKLAMIKIYHRFRTEKLNSRMIMQVHDELVIETPNGEEEKALSLVKYEMEHALSLTVPLKVDIASGLSWRLVD